MELVHVVGSVDCILSRSQILVLAYQIARKIIMDWSSSLISAHIMLNLLRSDGVDSLVLMNRAYTDIMS